MKPWQRIHLDFAGPFMGSSFLVVIDAHSKWPEVIEMPNTSASKTITALLHLFAAYGLPEQVVSDNGPQFTSEEFKGFLKCNGVQHIRCAPYHPSSNGAAERFVQTFKQAMRASDEDLPRAHRLANFLFTYRATPHATTSMAPATLFLQRDLRTRFSLIQPDPERRVSLKQAQQATHHDKHVKPRSLSSGQSVMIRNFRPGPKWVPGTVVRQLGPLSYLVALANGSQHKRHIDHIRAYSSDISSPSVATHTDFDLPMPTEDATVTTTDNNTSPQDQSSACRYPSRNRHPPERLQLSFGRGGV